jgi:hypothetical protein
MAENKKLVPPENLPVPEQEQDANKPEPSQPDKQAPKGKKEAPGAVPKEAPPKVEEFKPQTPAAPPLPKPGPLSNRAVWWGLVLFVIGIALGGAVGWVILAPETNIFPPPVVEPGPEPEPEPEPVPVEPALTPAQERDQRRLEDLEDLRLALTLYREENGSYPVSLGISRSTDGADFALSVLVEGGFIGLIPQDPLKDERGYYYGYQSQDGQDYILSSVAEAVDSTPCRQIRADLCIIEISSSGNLQSAGPGE